MCLKGVDVLHSSDNAKNYETKNIKKRKLKPYISIFLIVLINFDMFEFWVLAQTCPRTVCPGSLSKIRLVVKTLVI